MGQTVYHDKIKPVARVDWVNLLFNVIISDILAVYMTAHICAGGLSEKEVGPTIGLLLHRHFIGLLSARPSTDTGRTFLTLLRETALLQSPFTSQIGIRMTYSNLKLRVPTDTSRTKFRRLVNVNQSNLIMMQVLTKSEIPWLMKLSNMY